MIKRNDDSTLKQFKDYGFHYDAETGTLYSNKNKPIKNYTCRIYKPSINLNISCMKGKLCWYLHYGELPDTIIKYKDGDPNNCSLDNMILSEKISYDLNYHKQKSLEHRIRKGVNVGVKGRPVGSPNRVSIQQNEYKPKNYLNSTNLSYEIIISQGKGKLTNNAENMLISIAENMVRRFTYFSLDDEYDCKMAGILAVLERWRNFDHIKYDNSFAYFSEVTKRALAAGFNQINWKDNQYQDIPHKISLNNFNQ